MHVLIAHAKYPHYFSTWIITAKYIGSELLIQAKEIWKLKIYVQQLFLFLKVRFFVLRNYTFIEINFRK